MLRWTCVGRVNDVTLAPLIRNHTLMRPLLALLFLFGFQLQVTAQTACTTGLCLKQVSCKNGGSTTISGTVYAPNGTDPLPNVTVYIPDAPVEKFQPGVSCPIVGTPPSGSPLVGTTTDYRGKFQINNVPVGVDIPLVIVTGRWRRQVTVSTTECADTVMDVSFPKTQSEGDIPKIAVATGSVDSVECVLRKIGIDDSEFTNIGGSGRINLFEGDGGARTGGAVIDANTASESSLMGDANILDQYDVLMLPCEGGNYQRSAQQLANFVNFTSAGGRVYSSHFAYSWMYQNPPFDQVVNWVANVGPTQSTGLATVDTTFSEGYILAKWLDYVGASTTYGVMEVDTIKHDLVGVVKPTQSWLTLNNALSNARVTDNKPVMQFVFDTPVKATNQCGRVLFNEYHVEASSGTYGKSFPTECVVGAALTPQEKLLEFSLFELTSDGAAATLTPTEADFGTQAIGFTSATQSFTFTNNSTFSDTVNVLTTSGDYKIASSDCSVVASGASCTVNVNFTPTALGTRTGILTAGAGAQTLIASLTGKGVPVISVSVASLSFGSVDVGATRSAVLTVQNAAPGAIPFPGVTATGDFTAATTCGSTLSVGASCSVTVTFKPTTTGARTGTLSASSASDAYSNLNDTLTGNGIDFTIAISPAAGSVIAGTTAITNVSMAPVAGFSALVNLRCTTNAIATDCGFAYGDAVLSAPADHAVTINTTSKFTIVGYGGLGFGRMFALLAALSGGVLWWRRKQSSNLLRASLCAVLLLTATVAISGCSSKSPAVNPSYTAPGTYTYTITASDGFLVHTVTYALTVTAK